MRVFVLPRILQLYLLTLGLLSAEPLTLFDGKTLDQWKGNPSLWRVEDKAITASIPEGGRLPKNEFLYWKGTITDFDLSLQYRITGGPTANSGIQVRSQKDASGHAAGYQCDLDDGKLWLGRIYDEHGRALIAERGALTKISLDGKRHAIPFSEPASLTRFAKADDWNHYLIKARGPRIEIYINGIHFSTLEDYQRGEADLTGLLAVQLHSGVGPAKIQFRDITLTNFEQKEVAVSEKPAEEESAGVVPADAPNIGFEKGNYDGWTQTGTVWSKGPIKGDSIAARNRGNSLHDGDYWVGGYEVWLSDQTQGTLTSDPFKVTHSWATYRIGAGPNPETRVEIIDAASGKVIHKTSGRGEIENMAINTVDLKQYLGKMIRLRIVDEHSGHWGHINYDDFRFYKTSPKASATSGGGRLGSSPLLWNLKPNPAGKRGEITSRMFIPEGFQVETIAQEPQLRQPIAFTFDSRGRIWIAEAFAYPRRQDEGKGTDRLIILEDTDHDGTFETHKVFADNLNLISGFEIGYGGVFAACAPEFIFIPDADGDDRPDGPPEVLLDGFSIRDTHETPNSFLWGHDGWLYGCHGVFNPSLVGKPGTPKEDRLSMKAAIWRFHPVTHEFEIYSHGGSNQWGLDYGPDGSLFMTHCRSSWGLGPVSQVFRDGHYWTQNNSNHRDFVATDKVGWNRTSTPLLNYFDSIAAYGHGEGGAGASGSRSIFGGHSHVGTMIYLGDNWPAEYRGDLFTHNLHGHQLNREILALRDSAYLSSSHGQDIFYTPDKKYLAVDLKYGPDGAVYSIDWFDTQQCHVNDAARWDRTNGRLYRMSWTETFESAKFEDLAKASEKQLLVYLSHDNEWFARMAQHQIRQRAAAGSLSGSFQKSLRSKLYSDNNPHRFRDLVALFAAKAFNEEDALRLIRHSDTTLRNQALHFITDRPSAYSDRFTKALRALAESEPSAQVRLTLAGACQHRLPENLRIPILLTLSHRDEDVHDRFIPKMIWFGLATNAGDDTGLLADLAQKTPLPILRDSILWHLAREDAEKAITVANKLTEPTAIARTAAVFSQALTGKELSAPPSWAEFSAKAGATGKPEAIDHLAKLQVIFGLAESQAGTEPDKIHSKGKPIAGARKIRVDAAKGLKFAQELFTARAGEALELTFDNKDAIPHNLVLIKPGSFQKVGTASDAFISNPKAAEKHYVPDIPEIIDFTPVLNPGETFSIHMRAPSEPGDYPYVCTFPGHWRVMKGTLRVRQVDPNAKKILFLAGRDSHGWGAHQHFGGTNILAKGMRNSALPVELQVIRKWPDDETLLKQDALVIYADGWGAHPANGKLGSLKKFMDQGGGLTVIHWATGLGSPDVGNKTKDHSVDPVRRQWRNLVGADFEPWHSVSRFWDASFEKLPKHPVTRGVPPFVIHDECYFHLRCTDPEHDHVTPLHGAVPPVGIIHPGRRMDSGSDSAVEAAKRGEEQYCAWGFDRPAGGRTFGFTGGHTHWNWGRDELRKLILNGIYWTTGAEVPSSGISSTRPTATEMLEHLQGNPGWTAEGLQILLDRAGNGELVKWNQFSGGPLPVGPKPAPKPKKDLGPGLIIEGERLKVLKATGTVRPQAMQKYGNGTWSGNSQLWWIAEKEDAILTLEFAVPKAGQYSVYFAGTKAVDYGIHSFSLNGEAIGKPQDFFQPTGVSHTGQISLGSAALKKGTNTLTVKSTGTHSDSVKRYMFGLDFLRLAPQ